MIYSTNKSRLFCFLRILRSGSFLWLFLLLLAIAGFLSTTANSNELSPPSLYGKFDSKVAPDFLEQPLISSYSLPSPGNDSSLTKKESKKHIQVTKVQIKGNASLNKKDVSPIIKKIMGKSVSIEKLEIIRYEISRLYYDKGYINSGVILPAQNYDNGVVVFIAIEGVLSDMKISGLSSKETERMKTEIANFVGSPLNISKLQSALNKINSLPVIEKMNAKFYTGESPDKGILELKISKARDYHLISGVDNYRSPTIGAERAYIAFQHNNVSGAADSITLQAGLTEGVNDYSFRYDYPVNTVNSHISTYYVKSDSQFVEESIAKTLNISNSTSIYGIDWKLALNDNKLFLKHVNFAAEFLKNNNSLIGLEKENVINISGHQMISAYSIEHRINSTLRLGQSTTENPGTISPNEASENSNFHLVKIKTVSTKKIPTRKTLLRLRTYSQILTDSLRSLERFSMGGFRTVRGYRENTLVRDNGLILNAEAVIKLPVAKLTATLFSDMATGWDNSGNAENKHLVSIGGGFTWNNQKNLYAESFLGLPLMNKLDKTGNLQDLGLHFGLQYRL